ncbi:hypothetical protein FPOAC1_011854 [Fusarium poae]|jgi:hypothetical protein|uniref:hypothetical protein n=1 Tax=Fusarium poae TaxID=36050 RepID=UPI001CE96ED0|nr:hypothetical protein FPOAC1_011854 [Fusarium poae]KAG8667032.1 hypothetical protein FPOAC1_011854 [Fusarium poae]
MIPSITSVLLVLYSDSEAGTPGQEMAGLIIMRSCGRRRRGPENEHGRHSPSFPWTFRTYRNRFPINSSSTRPRHSEQWNDMPLLSLTLLPAFASRFQDRLALLLILKHPKLFTPISRVVFWSTSIGSAVRFLCENYLCPDPIRGNEVPNSNALSALSSKLYLTQTIHPFRRFPKPRGNCRVRIRVCDFTEFTRHCICWSEWGFKYSH